MLSSAQQNTRSSGLTVEKQCHGFTNGPCEKLNHGDHKQRDLDGRSDLQVRIQVSILMLITHRDGNGQVQFILDRHGYSSKVLGSISAVY